MTDILVIGANPTGLALANMLIQHEISVKVIDHRSSPEEPSFLDCRNLPVILSCSALELLHNGGILQDFLKTQHKIFGARYHWKKRSLLFKFNQTNNSPTPFSIITTYQELETHLREVFIQRGGVIDWATRPVTLIEDSIFIENVTSSQNFEKREIYNPKWIIACEADADPDIKDLLKSHIKRKTHKETFFAHCHEGQPFEESHVHLIPLTKLFLNFVFFNPIEKTKQLYLPYMLSPKLKEKLRYTYNLNIAEEFSHIKATLNVLPAEHGNILFLGQLAQSLSFSYVNGINANIHAAFNLAWKLIPVLKQAASKYLVKVKEQRNGNLLPLFSEKIERRTKKLPFSSIYAPALMYYFLKGCRQLDHIGGEYYYPPHKALKYRSSDLIKISPQDKEIQGPGPGMRAADIQLENGTFLLDPLHGTKHQLIFFKDREDLYQALKEEYGEWIEVTVVKDPKVFKLYHANPNSLFIIRPDRYIGYRTHEFKLHELISYLLRIFAAEQVP